MVELLPLQIRSQFRDLADLLHSLAVVAENPGQLLRDQPQAAFAFGLIGMTRGLLDVAVDLAPVLGFEIRDCRRDRVAPRQRRRGRRYCGGNRRRCGNLLDFDRGGLRRGGNRGGITGGNRCEFDPSENVVGPAAG
ncbi:MAG: hypothetical protein ACLQU2_03055 [Candidatus Binataceae bacterium]